MYVVYHHNLIAHQKSFFILRWVLPQRSLDGLRLCCSFYGTYMNSIKIHIPCTQFVTNTPVPELLTALDTIAILHVLQTTRPAPKTATPKAVRKHATPGLRNAIKMVVMGKCLAKRERSVNKTAIMERVPYLATIRRSVIKNVCMKSAMQHVARG